MTKPAAPEGSTQAPIPGSATTTPSDKSLPQFIARGNEPFWSISVSGNGNTLTWITPENPKGTRLSAQQVTSGDGVRYIGRDGDKTFMLEVVGGACTDTMSGHSFEFAATWVYAGDSNAGCAERAAK
ncbi:Uncharacterized membrane protein [Pseudomonas mucidolens]|uniref:Uncharacterized membrane protein n=1 Tax=Pseudomonas mucidolens TaxID=46679 RepID=A0A1H2MHF5_9PSED|nr:Uncharacterized membrane protein [Pseudomonas mucidolens]